MYLKFTAGSLLGSTLELEAIQGLMRALSFFKGVLIPHGAWWHLLSHKSQGTVLVHFKNGGKDVSWILIRFSEPCRDSKNILISLYIVKTFSFVKDGLIKQQQNSIVLEKAISEMIYILCMMEDLFIYDICYVGYAISFLLGKILR